MEKTMEEVGAITRHNSKNIQHVMTEIEGSRKLMVEMLAMLTGGKRTIAVPTKKVLQAGTSGLQKGRIEENSMHVQVAGQADMAVDEDRRQRHGGPVPALGSTSTLPDTGVGVSEMSMMGKERQDTPQVTS
jgi:hypothetical protein